MGSEMCIRDRVNVDTPVNKAMVNVVKAIDAGELESGFENVELVLSSAGH